jgi:signal transduction histidine kinase
MKLKQLLVLFFILFSTSIVAQRQQINQLKKQLSSTTISDSLRVKLLGDLGYYYGNVNIDSSFFYTRKGLSLALKTNNQIGIGQSYNDIGIIHYRTSKFDSARYFYNKSLIIRKVLKDSVGIAGLYSKIGISYQQTSTLDSALFYNNQSLRIYESLGMKRHVVINQNNIANIYQNLNQFDKALEMHQAILAEREKSNRPAELAESYVNIGNVYQKLNEFETSKKYYNKAIELSEKHNLIRNLSILYNNYGNIYKEEAKMELALEYYQKAYNIRKQLNDAYGLSSVTGNLGVLYFEAARFKTAEPYLHESLFLAKKFDAKELELSAYKVLLMLKAYIKQPDSTIYYQKKYENLDNLIRNKNITKQIVEIETKYETEKKEKEIIRQRLAIKNKNLYAIIITSVLLIIIIISYALYKKQQYKRKQLQREIHLKDALAKIQTQNRLQEQRLRISRDLHDNIGSQLTFIISSIDNLKFITKDANDKLKDKLSSISSFTSDTIFQLRDTIWAMNKSEITIEDLQTRIMSFIEKAKTASENIQFNVDVEASNEITFTSVNGIHIFRVVQEAINNSIKYANADNISVKIKENKSAISFTISDNGQGFDKKNVALGNGLLNMEKRIEEVDGKLKITSSKEKGTNINFTINK